MSHEEAKLFAREGGILVSSAREAISNFLQTSKVVIPSRLEEDPRFERKMGCFVTLRANDAENSLRGCIGFAEPIFKLSDALTHAAIAAATEDPRFRPVSSQELDDLLIEVSILTPPSVLEAKHRREMLELIEVGKDGLILRWAFGSGLLLPQVPKEFGWDAEEFLANVSMKAGALSDEWLDPGSTILKFRAQVFQEKSPKGEVVEE